MCLKRFGYVLVVGSALVLQEWQFEFQHMMSRMRIFSKEHMESTFGEYHRMHMGADAPTPTAGYPDCGAGWYSKRLDYKDWYEFNNQQRVYANCHEHMVWLMPMMLVGDLF